MSGTPATTDGCQMYCPVVSFTLRSALTVAEAKNYLRVEHSEDDELIQSLLLTAKQTVQDVGRVSAEQYEQEETCHTATLYAVAYLYTHRENADHNALLLTLRAMLFAQREGVI